MSPIVAEESPLILRPAQLDERATVILCAVWNAWAQGWPAPSYIDLMALTGVSSKGGLYWRLKTLERHGWLTMRSNIHAGRLPGPRLFAVSNGVPLELVGAWQEPAISRSRTPKWDRRSVLTKRG